MGKLCMKEHESMLFPFCVFCVFFLLLFAIAKGRDNIFSRYIYLCVKIHALLYTTAHSINLTKSTFRYYFRSTSTS